MNMKHLWILTTLLLAVCCNAQTGGVNTAPTHNVTITEDQNGQTVDVALNDDVVVTFVAAGGTGYAWQMEPSDMATAKAENVALKPGLPGGPLKTMFHVQVKRAGTVTLKFDFSRAWEKNTPPAKTFSVTLRVQ